MGRGRRAGIMVAVVLVTLLAGMTTAFADDRDVPSEQDLVARINDERARRGLAPLAVSGDLVDVARRHSAEMARSGRLAHNPNLPNEVSNWRSLGENVGTGGGVEPVHTSFMASTIHRDEILEPVYSQVGVGVVWSGDRMWVTQVFRQPMAASAPVRSTQAEPAPAAAAPAPAPAPPPAAAPAPAPVAARTAPPAPAPAATTPAPAPAAPVAVPPAAPPTTAAAAPAAPPVAAVATLVAGVRRARPTEVAAPIPTPPVPGVPGLAGAAAALLAAVVALQGVVVRRLRLT